jgi:hypothetical protein
MVLGSAFHLGERFAKPPLISSTLYRSFAFLALLIILNVIEEAVVGMLHGKTVLDSISDIAGGTWYQIVVTSFILLVLIPYFAFRALGDVVGHQILIRLFFEPNRSGIDSSRP